MRRSRRTAIALAACRSNLPSAKPWQFSIWRSGPRGAEWGEYTGGMYAPFRPKSRFRSGQQVPEPLAIAHALQRHEGLARLGALMRESNRRMELIRHCLPGALVRFVQAGPVDEEGWTLLAANAAVAAKLRHLQPRLQLLLEEAGLQPAKVRVKVQQ